jgi:hypothetical protein
MRSGEKRGPWWLCSELADVARVGRPPAGQEKELKEAKIRRLQSMLNEIDFSRIDEAQIVRDVRETREGR